MKLEQIAPYLSHNIEMKILNYKSDYVGIEQSVCNGFYMIGKDPYFTYKGGSIGKSFAECKFLMRPLSDLTKPILEGGKIPIVEFYQLEKGSEKLIDLDEWCEELVHLLNTNHPFQLSQFQKLFEWHMDIFGLIESGEAIDINTLTK